MQLSNLLPPEMLGIVSGYSGNSAFTEIEPANRWLITNVGAELIRTYNTYGRELLDRGFINRFSEIHLSEELPNAVSQLYRKVKEYNQSYLRPAENPPSMDLTHILEQD